MTKEQWIAEAKRILVNPPFHFRDRYAVSYAEALANEYYAEGFDPQDALKDAGYYRMAKG